jgi:hypothetical protein
MLQVALKAINTSSYAAGCTESHQTLLMLQVALKAITALELQLGTVNRNADCAASQAVRERKLLQHQIIASSLLGRHQVGELFELQSLLVPVACHFCARAPFSLQTTDRHTHTHTHTPVPQDRRHDQALQTLREFQAAAQPPTPKGDPSPHPHALRHFPPLRGYKQPARKQPTDQTSSKSSVPSFSHSGK